VNPVNVNATGTYTVTYNVSDASGNAGAQVTRTVNVVSVLSTFSITTTVSGSGSITPSGTVNVTQGNDQSFTVTPDPSNDLISLVVDGIVIPATTTVNFINVQATQTIIDDFINKINGPCRIPKERLESILEEKKKRGVISYSFEFCPFVRMIDEYYGIQHRNFFNKCRFDVMANSEMLINFLGCSREEINHFVGIRILLKPIFN
jgi:hypothetical protein